MLCSSRSRKIRPWFCLCRFMAASCCTTHRAHTHTHGHGLGQGFILPAIFLFIYTIIIIIILPFVILWLLFSIQKYNLCKRIKRALHTLAARSQNGLCGNAEMQRILFIEITISFKLMSRLLFRLSHVNFAHKNCQIVRRVGRSGLSRFNCEFSLTILFCNFGERAAHLPFCYETERAFE